jgi:aminoglycoside phosphotransferase family enzyme/predicted kinase
VHIAGEPEVSQNEIAAAMADPGFYARPADSVECVETHTSTVFLAGDRAYKIKKPVRYDFLDYTSLAIRRRMCEREVALNRRLGPGIYLGVRSIVRTDTGFALGAPDRAGAVEYAVEMCRFDASRTLASQVASHRVGVEQIRDVAALLADFHAAAPVVDRGADPRPAIRRTSAATFTTLFELAGAAGERDVIAAERFTNAFLVKRREVMLERSAAGLVRDGHGDLRAEHVILERPIEIVDCIEFDPALRRTDVASDLAFLVMDLHRLGAARLAGELVDAYRAHGGDPGDDGLLAFYAAQRAWVRAKIELLRAAQIEAAGGSAAGVRDGAERLLALARRFAWRARQPLLLVVCGLSGSGKSHLIGALAAASGLRAITSDGVRKELAGEWGGADLLYSHERNSQTYVELGRLAARELERSGAVMVDATFRHREDRRAFAHAAGDAFAAARFVECVAPRELRLRRVRRRSTTRNPSDATPAVAAAQEFYPLDEIPASAHLPLRTDRPAGSSVAEVERWLDG